MNLDCKGSDSRNDIKGAVKHTVVREGWVVLPNGSGRFHHCNLRDVIHHINIREIDDMSEAPVVQSVDP